MRASRWRASRRGRRSVAPRSDRLCCATPQDECTVVDARPRAASHMPEGELFDVAPLDCIRVAPSTARALEAGETGLEFIAVGPHHPGDGEPAEDPYRQLELEDGFPFGDFGRIGHRADVVADPLRSAPGGLVRPGLVFADRHRHAAVATTDGRVVDEARDPADEGLHVFLALPEQIEQLRRALARIGPNDYVHTGLPFAWRVQLCMGPSDRTYPKRPSVHVRRTSRRTESEGRRSSSHQ